jgi:hypothetical protein
MILKQKLLIVAATVLPLLAISTFLLLMPTHVSASSCPPGERYWPCMNNGCNSGYGYCYAAGSNGAYVWCKSSNGQCTGVGNGTCSSTGSCVTCLYGQCGS